MGIPVSDVSRKVYDNVFYNEEVDLHVSIWSSILLRYGMRNLSTKSIYLFAEVVLR